jgi:hypothetical protein
MLRPLCIGSLFLCSYGICWLVESNQVGFGTLLVSRTLLLVNTCSFLGKYHSHVSYVHYNLVELIMQSELLYESCV